MQRALQRALPGDRFGSLTVLAEAPRNKHYRRVEVRCDCGTTKIVHVNNLTAGYTISCGCVGAVRRIEAIGAWHQAHGHKPAHERVGERFGSLVILRLIDRVFTTWNVLTRCDCGREHTALLSNIVAGQSTSCGCVGREKLRVRATKHGLVNSPEHRAWAAMRSRCTNPRLKSWKHYGGRGITVCERWQTFENFYADMGRRPSPGHSIDRINNDGNYEPGNCRWATDLEQARNSRHVLRFEHEGKSVLAVEFYSRHGVSRQLYSLRVANGWPPYEAATMAPHARRSA